MKRAAINTCCWMLVLVAVILMATGSAMAQPRASIEPQNPQVYDTVTFAIRHSGRIEASSLPPPSSPNLQSAGEVRREASFSSTAGTSNTISWQYDAMQPGEFWVGPVDIVADGKKITIPRMTGTIRPVTVQGSSLPADIASVAGNPDPLASGDRALARHLTGKAFVTIEAPDELTVGWPLRVNTYIYLSTSLTGMEARGGKPQNAGGQHFITIPEWSTSHRSAASGNQTIGGESFQRWHVHSTTLVPSRAGKAEINGGSMTLDFLTAGRISRAMLTTIAFESPKREVEISPVPAPLTGSHVQVVGNHSVTTDVDRRELSQGELVTLTVRISGNGYLELASLNRMPDIDGLLFIGEDVSSQFDLTQRGDFAGTKIFRRSYQATRGGSITIPAIAMANYNPLIMQQEMRYSEPITLTVQSVVGGTRALAGASGQLPRQADARELGTGGILHINTAPLRISATSAVLGRGVFHQTWYWLLHAGVLLGAVGVAFFVASKRRTQRDPDARSEASRKSRVVAAFRDAERAKSSASPDEFTSALYAGLMTQIGRAVSREPGGLTIEDALNRLRLRGMNEASVTEIGALLEKCQNARYTPEGSASTRDEDLNRARRLVREMEKIQ